MGGRTIFDEFSRSINEIKSLNLIQKLLLIQVFFIFTPIYFTGLYLIFLFLYLLYKKEIIKAYRKYPKSKLLIVFIGITMLSSIFHKNLIGLFISIIFVLIFGIILVYKNYTSENLLYLIIKISTFMSLICVFIALIQFVQINLFLDSNNIFHIPDKPQYRVSSVFMNANYYATILEFVILMAFYKLAIVKNRESSVAFYYLVIFLNVFTLYLTGCRTAWFSLFLSIPLIFLFQKKYYLAFSLFITSVFIFLGTAFFELFPRLDTLLLDLHVRLDIWLTAIKGFLQNPFIGTGTFGYKLIYLANHGPRAPHSHSLYLEFLLDYGIIGTTIFLVSCKDYLKRLFLTSHLKSYGLIIGIILVVLIHGILDVTILNLQVGLLFLFLIFSTEYYEVEKI